MKHKDATIVTYGKFAVCSTADSHRFLLLMHVNGQNSVCIGSLTAPYGTAPAEFKKIIKDLFETPRKEGEDV